MLPYRRFMNIFMLLKRSHFDEYTRTKHDQISSVLFNCDLYNPVAEQTPSHISSHWFVDGPFDTSRSSELLVQKIKELKAFDDFGLLSSWKANSIASELFTCATGFSDGCVNYDSRSRCRLSAIPTTADPSELGGLAESDDMEQSEELLDKSFCHSPVLHESQTSQESSDGASTYGVQSLSSPHVSNANKKIQHSDSLLRASRPSSAELSYSNRFDPDIKRTCRSTAEEIVTAVHSQDISLLRSILMEKKWPDHRSIGAHLDDVFELIIRDSYDIDEALLFLRDFAACNSRGFLHDLNGIRLACRVARESGSLAATVEILRLFRNMFLVRSPDTTNFSTSEVVLDEFYKILCSIGNADEIEELHKVMISYEFEKNSNIFIRVFTGHLLTKNDFITVFDNWKRLSSRYGTTFASDLIWKGIFTLVSDKRKQVDLAGDLLAQCQQYDHPSTIIANIIVVLIRLNQVDAARSIFTKVSIPGRFFKKPLKCIAYSEDALKIIENFASLVTECMFAEKRRCRYSETRVESSVSFLSSELLSKLNTFYGMGRSRHRKFSHSEQKLKLHRINDEQLFELSELVQLMWIEKAETNNDTEALDRLVSWSVNNRLEIPSKINTRIVKMRSSARSSVAITD